MISNFLNWLDHRTGYKHLAHEMLIERIPGGARWRYVWGSTLTFTFFIQMVTGIALAMAYSANGKHAWESVYYIQNEMTLGWLVRGIHHFAAQAMVVLLVFHLVQVVIDGAYRAPREINFWLGLVLMQIVLGLGLTGYLLPWDQKGYYATKVATGIVGSTPVVGESMQKLMQGGAEYGHHTLTRFFALHVTVLPGLMLAFLVLHIYVFRRHKITVRDAERAPDASFWPDQILKDAIACMAVLAAVMGLAIWKGAELSAPANPAEAYNAARPEWYYLFLFRFLKFGWVSQMGEATGLGEAFGAVVIPGALMTVLIAMPIIAYYRGGHRFNVYYLWFVVLGAIGLTGLALYEDRYSDRGMEFRFDEHQAHVDGERAIELASRNGIPADGALALVNADPHIQGPKLFRTYCAECHQPASMAPFFKRTKEDGTSEAILPKAPELADLMTRHVSFGSRDWTRQILVNFAGHLAHTKNMPEVKQEQVTALLDEEGSGMAYWSKEHREMLNDAANANDVTALVEFLYAQSGRQDALPPDDKQYLRGREIFEMGQLTKGSFESACAECHSLHVRGEAEVAFDGGLPDLTNYGGSDWNRRFLSDPAAVYGENNAMPAFGDQLSPQELDLLARWLAGDYE
ncbi:MAG: cytochrome b N-terminal domain-containing protein [Planctomycetaceae bacterium]